VIPQITVEYEPPNSNMNKFVGRLVHNDHKIPLNNNNLLLRSSRLKNTEFVYLLVLYTGHQSKIVLSMNKPSQKKSVIEQKLGYYIFGVFLFMIGLSFVASGLNLHMRIASKHSTTY
jgi:phospholipid-translocating ATPase